MQLRKTWRRQRPERAVFFALRGPRKSGKPDGGRLSPGDERVATPQNMANKERLQGFYMSRLGELQATFSWRPVPILGGAVSRLKCNGVNEFTAKLQEMAERDAFVLILKAAAIPDRPIPESSRERSMD